MSSLKAVALLSSILVMQFFPVAASATTTNKIKVIGAGYGRTGTDSLRRALNLLGFDTYHMYEVIGLGERKLPPLEFFGLVPGHCDAWAKAGKDVANGKKPDFRFLHSDPNHKFTAAVDAPAAFFYKELFEENPDAKVILTIRDPEAWHRSINKTNCRLFMGGGSRVDRILMFISSLRPFGRRCWRMHDKHHANVRRILAGSRNPWEAVEEYSGPKICQDKEYALEFFQRWNERVHEIVPKKQLLVFQTGKHGLKEIADFLGVDIPKDPDTGKPLDYPRTNSAAEFQFMVKLERMSAVLTILGVSLLARYMYRSLTGKKKEKEN